MAPSSIIAGLTPKTQNLKEVFLGYLISAAEIALKDEPKTLRYSIALPRDENAPGAKSIYVLEEYEDGAGFDVHLQQKAVQSIMHHVENGGLADEPVTLMLSIDGSLNFTRSDIDQLSDPFVTVTEFFYKPGTGRDALLEIASVFAAGKAESGTWGLSLYPEANSEDVLRVVGNI
ncbi:hypothetical protein PMIN04_012139 [Paraphaeosphaeria minitans]|uniref:ABM domain-containing protein n=1 Tax=Paraphaeosphaeria minitans TaxID=565426 RepID=A0A9P6G7B5_9PLEO|nr:hypothetical protein PMIN01_12132 [Paraphaeosphaeria minitans]